MIYDTYQNNIESLKINFPKIYEFMSNTKSNTYSIKKDQEENINLLEEKSGEYVYKENPKNFSEKQVLRYFEDPSAIEYKLKEKNKDDYYFAHQFHLYKLEKTLAKIKGHCKFTNKTIPTIIIFGVGLGYHIEKIALDYDPINIYIIEPEIDIFHSSMHTANWKEIFNKMCSKNRSITIKIGGGTSDFINKIGEAFAIKGHYSCSRVYLYKHLSSNEINNAYEKLVSVIHRVFQGFGFYEDELLSITHTIHNYKNNLMLLKNKEEINYSDHYIPAAIIANGPSLDNDIDFLKKNQSKFIIFSCGSTLKTLHKNGIMPDFHVEIERTKLVYDSLIEIHDDEYLKNIILLSSNLVYPKTTNLFKTFISFSKFNDSGHKIIAHSFTKDLPAIIYNTNPTVSNAGLSIATHLGFNQIYLFGMDMAFKDPKNHHSKDSFYFEKNSLFFKNEIECNITTKGNFIEQIFTNLELDHSKFSLECQLFSNKQISCFNCSDGARIECTTPIKSKEIKFDNWEKIDKNSFIQSLTQEVCFKNTKINGYEIEKNMHKYYMLIESIISHIKESWSINPKTFKDIDLLFRNQFEFINSYHEKNSLVCGLIMGSLDYLQCSIFIGLLNIKEPKKIEEAINISSKIFMRYFDDMLEITRTTLSMIDKDLEIKKIIKISEENINNLIFKEAV